MLNLLKDKQQFGNALNGLTTSFERGDGTDRKTSLNETEKIPFDCYNITISIDDTPSNDTAKLCVVCSKKCENALFCCKCEQPIHVSCLEVYYTENKMIQKVCRLCLNRINIEKERQGAKECLETQATKMKTKNLVMKHL